MKKIILFSIIVIIVVALGFISYQLSKDYQIVKKQNTDDRIAFIKSGLVSSWNAAARGTIINISDTVLTLSSSGEILSIPVADDAMVNYLVVDYSTDENSYQKAQFSDLKINDNVTITIKFIDGKAVGQGVVILPF